MTKWLFAGVLFGICVTACSGGTLDEAGVNSGQLAASVDVHALETFTVALPFLRNNLGAPGQFDWRTNPAVPGGGATEFQEVGSFIVPVYAMPPKVAVKLPRAGNAAFHLSDQLSDVEIAVRRIGTHAVTGVEAGGVVVWPRAHAGEADVFARVSSTGFEDYVVLHTPGTEEMTYEVDLLGGVAGIRLVDNTLEFLDKGGVPRIRVAPPYIIDSKQQVRAATLSVVDCEVDTDPRPAEGRPFALLTQANCAVGLTWDAVGMEYPVLVDPSWGSTTSTVSPRYGHGCLDPRGVVSNTHVCAGGINHLGVYLASAEVYSPASNTWSVTGAMGSARAWFSGVPSIDYGGNGAYLVTGGYTGTAPTASVEVYTTSSGTWASKASMSTPRVAHGASGLYNSTVLVNGGWNNGGYLFSTALYNVATNAWTAGPDLTFSSPRAYHTSTTLTNGDVLIAGGHDGSVVRNIVDYYIRNTGTMATAGSLPVPVFSHSATVVNSGTYAGSVFVGGGNTGSGATSSLQRFTGASWTVDGHVGVQREWHTATLLSDGRSILFAGGLWPYGSLNSGFVRDTSGGVGGTYSTMVYARGYHAAGLVGFSFGNGKPVVSGGWSTQSSAVVARSEVYQP